MSIWHPPVRDQRFLASTTIVFEHDEESQGHTVDATWAMCWLWRQGLGLAYEPIVWFEVSL